MQINSQDKENTDPQNQQNNKKQLQKYKQNKLLNIEIPKYEEIKEQSQKLDILQNNIENIEIQGQNSQNLINNQIANQEKYNENTQQEQEQDDERYNFNKNDISSSQDSDSEQSKTSNSQGEHIDQAEKMIEEMFKNQDQELDNNQENQDFQDSIDNNNNLENDSLQNTGNQNKFQQQQQNQDFNNQTFSNNKNISENVINSSSDKNNQTNPQVTREFSIQNQSQKMQQSQSENYLFSNTNNNNNYNFNNNFNGGQNNNNTQRSQQQNFIIQDNLGIYLENVQNQKDKNEKTKFKINKILSNLNNLQVKNFRESVDGIDDYFQKFQELAYNKLDFYRYEKQNLVQQNQNLKQKIESQNNLVQKQQEQIWELQQFKDNHLSICNIEELKQRISEQKQNISQLQNQIKEYEQQILEQKQENSKIFQENQQFQVKNVIDDMVNQTVIKNQQQINQKLKQRIAQLKISSVQNNNSLNTDTQKQQENKLERVKFRSNSMFNSQNYMHHGTPQNQNQEKIQYNNNNCQNQNQQQQQQQQEPNIRKQINSLKKEKEGLKKEINQWLQELELKIQRKVQKSDKEPIKHLYGQYNEISNQIKELEDQLQQDQLLNKSENLNLKNQKTNVQPQIMSKSINTSNSNNNKIPPSFLQKSQTKQLNINGSFEGSLINLEMNTPSTLLQNSVLNSSTNASFIGTNDIQKSQQIIRSQKLEIQKLKNQINKINSVQINEDIIKGLKIEIKNLSKDKEIIKDKLLKCQQQKESQEEQFSTKENELLVQIKDINRNLEQFQKQKEQLIKENQNLQVEIKQLQTVNIQQKKQLDNQIIQTNNVITQLQQETKIRQELHNQMLDLKGNIRVFCRVRPQIRSETEANHKMCAEVQNDVIELNKNNEKIKFTYDQCFGQNSSQEDISLEMNKLAQSAVDGYNCCVFAYGQTGSGKTYTMQGTSQNPGITPRIIDQIFTQINNVKSYNQINMYVYMVELYQDNLIDLLDSNPQESKKKLEIKEDITGQCYIQNVSNVGINSKQDMEKIIKTGIKARKTGKTDMNEESSRSHLIITICIEIYNPQTNTKKLGKLSLIDLAGSERIQKSNLSIKQINEARAINKSLTALGDVISALTQKNNSHIPYRNNKLTYLMKDSIGGNAKTVMFVNISPSEYNVDESKNSLQYASRVRGIINNVQQQIVNSDLTEINKKYKDLQLENVNMSDKLKLIQKQIINQNQNQNSDNKQQYQNKQD